MDELQNIKGIRIGGTNINNIRFSDDTDLIADTEEKFQRSVDGLNEACRRYGLKINIEKREMIGLKERTEPLTVGMSLGGVNLRKVK